MEDPKAWKPRKARHRNRKETRTEKPTLGKNGIQSHASRLVGQIITMVWSRPWATKNGMCWEGLRGSVRTAGIIRLERWFPLGLDQGSRLDIQSWWGCK